MPDPEGPDPAAGLAFLKERVRPAVAPDPAEVGRLVGKLDAPVFTDRQAASAALHRLGRAGLLAGAKANIDGRGGVEAEDRLLVRGQPILTQDASGNIVDVLASVSVLHDDA